MAGCFWEAFGARACLWACPQSSRFQCFTFKTGTEIICVSNFKYLKVLFEMFYSFRGERVSLAVKLPNLCVPTFWGDRRWCPELRLTPNRIYVESVAMTDAAVSYTVLGSSL